METTRFSLERHTTGRHDRYTCPQCGRKYCFVRYVDNTTGQPLDPSCGRCNHEQSCGYHYPPKEFFHDHPERKADYKEHNERSTPLLMTGGGSRQKAPAAEPHPACPSPKQDIDELPEELFCIDRKWLKMCYSTESTLMDYLKTKLSPDRLNEPCSRFWLGATRDRGIIYWQIDHLGGVRTGKIMHYKPDGHRIASNEEYARLLGQDHPSRVPSPLNWVHTHPLCRRELPDGWQLHQCLFGEHQLAASPDGTCCLVESEKTAVILTALYPEYVWMATGGCKNLKPELLKPLAGHRLYVFPDSGELDNWSAVLKQTEGIQYTISNALEGYPPNTDLADLLTD